MSKPTSKPEQCWYFELQSNRRPSSQVGRLAQKTRRYYKSRISRARRRSCSMSKIDGYDQWRDMVELMWSMCADWPEYMYPDEFEESSL